MDAELADHFAKLQKVMQAGAVHIVPNKAWWVSAHFRKTAKRGLHISKGNRGKGVVLVLQGSESSRGRFGWEGTAYYLSKKNTALAVDVFGSSHGGGQHVTIVVGLVTPSTPLLLFSGIACIVPTIHAIPESVPGLETQA